VVRIIVLVLRRILAVAFGRARNPRPFHFFSRQRLSYRTPVNDIFYASNLWLPGPCAKLLLNFNLHGIHHQNPAVPWNRLPLVFYEGAEIYHGNYFAAAARQLNGPVALQDLPVVQRTNS